MITISRVISGAASGKGAATSGLSGDNSEGSFKSLLASGIEKKALPLDANGKLSLVSNKTADPNAIKGAPADKKDGKDQSGSASQADPSQISAQVDPSQFATPLPVVAVQAAPAAESAKGGVQLQAIGEESAKASPLLTKALAAKTSAPEGGPAKPVKGAQDTAKLPAEIAAGGNNLPAKKAADTLAAAAASSAKTHSDQKTDAKLTIDTKAATDAKAVVDAKSATDAQAQVQNVAQPVQSAPVEAAKQAAKVAVETPVGNPGWSQEVGQKVVWMSNQKQHVAQLQLNPPNLGPMEVRITVNNDQTQVQFVSHHPEVRHAIEQAMPKLREMMADNGIQLGNTSVGAESFQQQQGFFGQDRSDSRSFGGFSQFSGGGIADNMPAATPRVSRILSGVDTFA